MEASAQHPTSAGTVALGGMDGRELQLEGSGLVRLTLMVNVVLDRLTAVDDDQAKTRPHR